jgi:hypothetical protein
MAIQRQPGDNANKTRYRTVNYVYREVGKPDVSGSATWPDLEDRRPSYTKGVVITLPGGTTFRKSTTYSHESWEVGAFSPAIIGPGKTGFQNLRELSATDGGRDGERFTSGLPTLRGKIYPNDAKNEAVTKALNKIADQKVNLGENLATLHQTVRLFGSHTSYLVESLQYGLRQRSWRKWFYKSYRDLKREGIANTTASEYLAYVYGLRPLMQDVWASLELAKGQSVKDLLLRAKGHAQRTEYRGAANLAAATSAKVKQTSWTSNSQTKCVLTARLDPNHRGLRALNQLGLLNPLGLAWDLIPFSFCVDWVLPIGPVLYALSAPAGLIFVDGSISFRNSEVRNLTYEINTISWNATLLPNSVPASLPVTYEGFQRTNLGSWPLPGLWVDQDPLRGDRWLKALALAIVNLRGSRPSYIR